MTSKAGRIESAIEELRKLISTWGSCLQDMDEIKKYYEFGEEYSSTLQELLNIEGIISYHTEKALRAEIRTMTENRQDEESDDSWLGEIESMAQEMGLEEELRAEIEYERSNTAEYYADREYDDDALSPRWHDVTHSATRQSEGSEDSYIDGIFRHMS
ncbi:DNA topoisomerase IV subunit A [Actinomadura verrucosospora]|uniref:DNA topoisomerase IV subunit A n=1 Tax=Actinomadura verrucosospora TaxID=46165 RepID=A0A7D3VX35_ACTVE|nr:DNA topoisomerase IV subunit A [Actinomadura verrucosospora]